MFQCIIFQCIIWVRSISCSVSKSGFEKKNKMQRQQKQESQILFSKRKRDDEPIDLSESDEDIIPVRRVVKKKKATTSHKKNDGEPRKRKVKRRTESSDDDDEKKEEESTDMPLRGTIRVTIVGNGLGDDERYVLNGFSDVDKDTRKRISFLECSEFVYFTSDMWEHLRRFMEDCTNLKGLDLHGNGIDLFPFLFSQKMTLGALVWLNLENNCMTRLPCDELLVSAPNITHLDFSDNNVTRLPRRLLSSFCPRLEYLLFSKNKVCEFPKSFFDYPGHEARTRLTHLDYSQNRFVKDPFLHIKNHCLGLETICFHNNIFNKEHVEIID